MLSKKISVMILAAGYGKRLQLITDNIPKPLIKVAGITLLQNTLDYVLKLNCDKIIINTHYQHEMIYYFIKKISGARSTMGADGTSTQSILEKTSDTVLRS